MRRLIVSSLTVLFVGLFVGPLIGLTARPAFAQAPAPDSGAAIAQPNAAAQKDDDIDAEIAAFTADPAKAAPAANAGDEPAPPRQIHGQAGVAFGNHGYRSGYVAADIPIGQTSDLDVAVADSQYKFKHGPSVDNKSLFIGLSLGTGTAAAAAGCRSQTVSTDGRYLEPMWVAEAHGEALARDQQSCAPPPNVYGR